MRAARSATIPSGIAGRSFGDGFWRRLTAAGCLSPCPSRKRPFLKSSTRPMTFFKYKNTHVNLAWVTSATIHADGDEPFDDDYSVELFISPQAGLTWGKVTLKGDDARSVVLAISDKTLNA